MTPNKARCEQCQHDFSAHRTKTGRNGKCHMAKVSSDHEEIYAKCPCKKFVGCPAPKAPEQCQARWKEGFMPVVCGGPLPCPQHGAANAPLITTRNFTEAEKAALDTPTKSGDSNHPGQAQSREDILARFLKMIDDYRYESYTGSGSYKDGLKQFMRDSWLEAPNAGKES